MDNKREHNRHKYEEKVFFDYIYDFQAKVAFKPHDVPPQLPYEGTTCNVSTKGLCFTSDRQLNEGDVLDMEVFVPGGGTSVQLQGEVRWNKLVSVGDDGQKLFNTGVQLTAIGGKSVDETIYFDAQYRIYWNDVLEALLGAFRKINQEKNDKQ